MTSAKPHCPWRIGPGTCAPPTAARRSRPPTCPTSRSRGSSITSSTWWRWPARTTSASAPISTASRWSPRAWRTSASCPSSPPSSSAAACPAPTSRKSSASTSCGCSKPTNPTDFGLGSRSRRVRREAALLGLLGGGEFLAELGGARGAGAVEVLVGGEAAQATLHVGAGLVERDLLDEGVERQRAARLHPPRHRARPGVVRGERQRWMVEAPVHLAQVRGADADVHLGVDQLPGGVAAQLQALRNLSGSRRHQLRQAQSARRGQGRRIERALLPHERLQQIGGD